MQSRPFEVSQESSPTGNQGNPSQPSQYGFDSHHESPDLFHSGERVGDPRPPASNTDRSTSPPSGNTRSRGTSSRGLNTDAVPQTPSPVDRIALYEKALTTSPKKTNTGPGFTVVPRAKKSITTRSTFADFPNGMKVPLYYHITCLTAPEVLTHILSHLPPASLSAVSLVSRRFHSLVTTPHAWRVAFSRYFPGSEALSTLDSSSESSLDEVENLSSERRVYTRLTALASWRSEYILRTRLLRSLGRGKPAEFQGPGASGSSRSGNGHSGNAQVTYNSNLFTTINHLGATFGTGLNKRLPRFIHGADETGSACSSDPNNGKVDSWGFSDPQNFLQFADRFPGEAEYGLGAGDVVGVPNPMDVSQKYGMIYAEGSPGGMLYYRSTEEQRGRALTVSTMQSAPENGIPQLHNSAQSVCVTWIAKFSSVPTLTDGLVGILSGSSSGIVTSYSLGTDSLRERRLERGEVTARWMLSPGIPIIAITVDESFSTKRHAQGRIWAIALNALGEVFYLTSLPTRRVLDRGAKLNEDMLERFAWETGRTVCWTLIEPTRRRARPDPFSASDIDGSYSPRSSWNGLGLSKQQIVAETREIETFANQKPKHFRKMCEGWDMRRLLEADFAGGDEHGAGEAVIVIDKGLDGGEPASIQRFTRVKIPQTLYEISPGDVALPLNGLVENKATSVFGGGAVLDNGSPLWSFAHVCQDSTDQTDLEHSPKFIEEWRVSSFSFGGLKATQVVTTAMDMSTYSLLTVMEDPLLGMMTSSANSSPLSSPLGQTLQPGSPSDIPGQRARFLAAGTKTGTIILWDIRSPISSNNDLINTIQPVRIIHTDSPQISCLALSALYLVHGGNDGLVQAWDPLSSIFQPIRTLNSRFSSRARRRLVQAEASPQGVGINLFAAGAICLDPDPTVLRGMVSLGTHLRYWSYSSSAADQYKSSKRRTRRSERGSNQGGERFSGTGRGVLKDYIANEKLELETEKENRRKEEERLAGRFGLDLLGPGASEDEIMAYATLLSEEAAKSDELKRRDSDSSSGAVSSDTITEVMSSPLSPQPVNPTEVDADLAEAIRLSLQDTGNTSSRSKHPEAPTGFPITYAKNRKSPSSSPPRAAAAVAGGSSRDVEGADLDFALQLSLAEEKSRMVVEGDEGEDLEFPVLVKAKAQSPPAPGKEKGKGKGNEKRRSE